MRFGVYSNVCIVMENNNNNGNNADRELDRFRQILNNKINEKKSDISFV
jgi:hypothetical protein